MPTAATRALYRAFMHTARELERRKQPLLVQVPVLSSRVQWYKPGAPQSQYVPTAPTLREMLRERFPWLPDAEPRPDGDASRDLPSEELRRLIRQAFRRELDTAGSAEVDLASSQRLDAAFSALRELHTQMELLRCSSATASEAAGGVRVRVEATSCYRGKQGPTGPWVFQYRVRWGLGRGRGQGLKLTLTLTLTLALTLPGAHHQRGRCDRAPARPRVAHTQRRRLAARPGAARQP